jgi:hypothetical protein
MWGCQLQVHIGQVHPDVNTNGPNWQIEVRSIADNMPNVVWDAGRDPLCNVHTACNPTWVLVVTRWLLAR